MSRQSLSSSHRISIRLLLVVSLLACLVWLALTFFRGSLRNASGPVSTTATTNSKQPKVRPDAGKRTLDGQDAQNYLAQSAEGQSLMTTIAKVRFGLERREKSPFSGDQGKGYLGMSHDENLNAWFDNEGVTVRPTVNSQERAKSWRMQMRLRAYGYGNVLHEARKQTTPTVKENRIEYERSTDEAGARVVEWYINKSEGIEQGFTLDERPRRNADTSDNEPLRLAVSVTGDLRARASDNGQSVELSRRGAGVLSYSKLIALDARGQKLVARMETNETGDEIGLVVEDAAAQYPIVVDPITATLKQELSAGAFVQAEARFGFAVAIDGNLAVVGAWREDAFGNPDVGRVYPFSRSSNTWSFDGFTFTHNLITGACGWSVDVSDDRIVYSCPGADTGGGRAYITQRNVAGAYSTPIEIDPGPLGTLAGDRYGESVAINGNVVVIGAPFHDNSFGADAGEFWRFKVDSNLNVSNVCSGFGTGANYQFGTSVDVSNHTSPETIVVGSPGADSARGRVDFFRFAATNCNSGFFPVMASDGVANDRFGHTVAIDGTTAVITAFGDDNERGTDAGAAYVFESDDIGIWTQQQKLMASDGRNGDLFGEHAVAIEGNTIVVGAYANGQGGDPLNGIPDDDRGAVYVFTPNNGVWSQQTKISQGNFAGGEPGDHFGIDVDISNNTVIIGTRAASAGSTLRAGTAFIYELNCLPPYQSRALFTIAGNPNTFTACPGASITITATASIATSPLTIQWRKNGDNIPGANTAFYTISNVSASDAGSYDFVLANACGSEISTPATLNVHTFSLNPASQNFSASGSNGIVNVTATGSCGWTAASNDSWINITSGASGTGNGTVGFSVAANTGAQRNGTVSIGDQTFFVTQDGTTPVTSTFQFSQSSYNVGEGAGNFDVTVTRTGNTTSAANVEYATTDGTANERGDYTTALGKLRFNAGETAKTFRVFITDDVYVEGTQSLNLTLSNSTGGTTIGSPSTATLSITDNDSAPPSTNPLDTTAFFVRQHYVDFLSREPDAPGLSFWINNIDSCGANASCREVKRIDTSAAFFLSIEFQETGFLVHRLYRSSFNRLSRYREFIRDSQEISRGVVVNSPGWEAVLEANKQAFTAEFIARADFLAIYGGMTNAQYVDALNVNTGNSLSTTERNALVNGLNGATETRASVLRKVAEDGDFRTRETSPAFVLMQYFGYLRRNPDDPPEPGLNFDGYNFWLNKLNSFGGDFRAAEMVKAFIVSGEYRARFGP
jgi:hypothetical protein